MNRKDLHNLKECYTQIFSEDLGIGPVVADNTTSVVGVTTPDNPTPQNYEDQAKSMAVADLKDAIKNISLILNELRSSKKLEAWVAEKITLASDYLGTVESWITNKE